MKKWRLSAGDGGDSCGRFAEVPDPEHRAVRSGQGRPAAHQAHRYSGETAHEPAVYCCTSRSPSVFRQLLVLALLVLSVLLWRLSGENVE